tara:strand:+ start:177 stop:341 length:165 start_codon:yes stop_codon:yes gene_type:complete
MKNTDEKIIKKLFVTYKIRDGQLVIETVTRRYSGEDYYDTTTTEPITKVTANGV